MSDMYDRRGFNERQLEQLDEMVRAAVSERIEARSAEEIDDIAEAAAKKAVTKMTDEAYRVVGKSVLDKLLWLLGLLIVGTYLWAERHGWAGKP